MTISVIIASYKRVECLKKCIQSLEQQLRKPDEVIIALQSSDKESIKFVELNKNKFSIKIGLAVTDKKGKIFQENSALAKIKNDIVCFIDDDAIARPDWLKKIEKWYKKDKKIGGVGGRDIVHQPDGTIDEKTVKVVGRITWYGRSIGNHHNITNLPQYVDFFKGCNMSYRKKLLKRINNNLIGYTVPFEEEWIGLNIEKKGYKLIYDPDIIVDHFPAPPRKDYQDIREWNRNTAFIRGYNQVYTLLTFLSYPRKIVFLLYTFLIGDKQNPGPGRLILSIFKKDFAKIKGFFSPSCRGKIQGLLTYYRQTRRKSSKLQH